MSGSREAVLRKFGGLVTEPVSTRRVDFKGDRRRLNLRMGEDVMLELQIIKLATGEAKNTFCEGVLRRAVAQVLAELRARYDDAAWEVIVACAKAGKK